MGFLCDEVVGGNMGKIAVVFPGQGAQFVGMGKSFYESFPSAKGIFDQASAALGKDMAHLCFNSSEEELRMTENTQPSILTVSYMIYQGLKESGLKADGFAGLSLGEFSALVAAGALSFEDAVQIVRERGKLMQAEVAPGKGAMAAILGADREVIEEACQSLSSEGIISVANYNCPQQIVIAGETALVEKCVEILKTQGAKKAVMLPVSAPFHTAMLTGAGEKLGDVLAQYPISPLHTAVYTNVSAGPYTQNMNIAENLMKQVSASVLWEDEILKMIEDGFDTFIEVGPGSTLSKFIKKISKQVKILNIETVEDLNQLDSLQSEKEHSA